MFQKANWNGLKRGDLIFNEDNPNEVLEVIKIKKNLIKLKEYEGDKIIWATRLRFNTRRYLFLEK